MRELYLNFNQLESIDDALNKLSKLTKLNLEGNQLKSLPKKLPATTLRDLSLRDNQITTLGNELTLVRIFGIQFEFSIFNFIM